jgi:hypothetical protein
MKIFRLLGSIERRIIINEDFPAVCVLHIDEYKRAMKKVYKAVPMAGPWSRGVQPTFFNFATLL